MSTVVPVLPIRHHCEDHSFQNFKIASFDEAECTITEFEEIHRHEYFEIIWLKSGVGIHQIDLVDYPYSGSVLFMLAPGQVHRIYEQTLSKGFVLKFLPSIFAHEREFFDYVLDTCLFDSDTSCRVIHIPDDVQPKLESLFSTLKSEFSNHELDVELMISSYLKIIITHINRVKKNKNRHGNELIDQGYELFRKYILEIEKNYKREHTVTGYAELLNIAPRILNDVARKYANKSAGQLIQDRILLEAQRSLYHESRTIKEICYELGFDDPAYFTRFFKRHTGIAPQQYKSTKIKSLPF